MSAGEFTPTTEQVRSGYAIDPVAEYHDPLTNHTLHNERAFDRWLAAHDTEVQMRAGADSLDFLADQFAKDVPRGTITGAQLIERIRAAAQTVREGGDR